MRRKIISAALALASIAALAPVAVIGQSSAQVTFENRTNTTGHLYVDDAYGCGPVLANLFCTTQVEAGQHSAFVRFDDGDVVTFEAFTVEAGGTFTLTVNMPPPQE